MTDPQPLLDLGQDPPSKMEAPAAVKPASPESHGRLRASMENMRMALEADAQDAPETSILQEIMTEMEAILRRQSRGQE